MSDICLLFNQWQLRQFVLVWILISSYCNLRWIWLTCRSAIYVNSGDCQGRFPCNYMVYQLGGRCRSWFGPIWCCWQHITSGDNVIILQLFWSEFYLCQNLTNILFQISKQRRYQWHLYFFFFPFLLFILDRWSVKLFVWHLFLCFSSGKEECGRDFDICGVEGILRNMSAVERAVLGFMCKDIIDMGRFMWLKEHGLESQLESMSQLTSLPKIICWLQGTRLYTISRWRLFHMFVYR